MKKEKGKIKTGPVRFVRKTYVNIYRGRGVKGASLGAVSLPSARRSRVDAKKNPIKRLPLISALNRQPTLVHSQPRRQISELILVINP